MLSTQSKFGTVRLNTFFLFRFLFCSGGHFLGNGEKKMVKPIPRMLTFQNGGGGGGVPLSKILGHHLPLMPVN